MKINNSKYQNFIKKVSPPLKLLTFNSFNQTNFKKLINKKSKEVQNILAFSLIELSIVLIIIGLLVSGIVGGQNLIQSAKLRNLINQFQDIEKQIYTFNVAKGRLPGDLDNNGAIDNQHNANISYKNTDFKFPYNGTDTVNNHYLPNTCSAPFVELYTEGISTFEPTGQSPNRDTTDGVSCRNTAKNGGLPFSNSFTANFFAIAANYPYSFSQDISAEKTFILLQSYNDTQALKASQTKNIDLKLDDGIMRTGKIRAYCRSAQATVGSYEAAIQDEKVGGKSGKCSQIIYYY